MSDASLLSPQRRSRGSGTRKSRPEPRYLAIGRIVRPWGVRGELKMAVLTEYPERLLHLRRVYVGPYAVPYQVVSVRFHRKAAILRLVGCEDRETAETLRGQLVQVPLEEAVPLEEDEYYEHQILGLEVETPEGEWLGVVTEIITTGSNDVYVVQGPEGELLLPALEDVVLEVDLERGRLLVVVPEGLR
ncbi:MAG: 16S rRNA processing protein RimM [Chloroflexi bacterium]|nr:MAG: 16S rRNA processing protein RimM [Chloroflexota bacterium]